MLRLSLSCPRTLVPASILAIVALTLAQSTDAETLYRWTDDKGVVHYTDSIPPEYADEGRNKLDSRGFAVETVAPAKTREQIEREAELERRRKEAERLLKEQQKADALLLKLYSSEEEIIMARDGKLASLDGLNEFARRNIQRLKLRLDKMQKEAANAERSGETVSKSLLEDIETVRQKIKRTFETIIEREQQKVKVRDKYLAQLQRYRTIQKLGDLAQEPIIEPDRPSLLETVVQCPDQESCDRAWARAENYVREHATTRMQMLGRNIIMTAQPREDEDISIAVSRIAKKGGSGSELFLDVQCKDSLAGDEFCRSEKVSTIRKGFSGYVTASH
jgi:hypothetical protein